MAAATGRVDDLVKDYLLYRGFNAAHKIFEAELKTEKERGLRADKLIEHLQTYIGNYELGLLREFWSNLNSRLFARLEQRYASSVRKLEVGLLKLYIVNAAQNNRQDKVMEFYEKMTSEIQNQSEFKEWFAFPFVRNPEENTNFAVYFTKPWQETYYLSLYNFLSVIIQAMPAPVLLNFDIEHKRMKNLQEENEMMKQKLLGQKPEIEVPVRAQSSEPVNRGANSMDLIYDFSALADESFEQEKQQKTSRRFNLNFSSSPLLGKKNSNRNSGTNNSIKKSDQVAGSKQQVPSKSAVKQKPTKPVNIQTKQIKANTGATGLTPPGQRSQVSSVPGNGEQTKLTVEPTETPRPASPGKLPSGDELQQDVACLTRSASGRSKSKVDHLKEREQLLGGSDTRKDKRHSESDITNPIKQSKPPVSKSQSVSAGDLTGTSGQTVRPVSVVGPSPPGSASAQPKQMELTQFPVTTEIPSSTKGTEVCPFLLLSQEEYGEHRAALSHCRFSNTGQFIASVDVDGVVKVWTWSPQPSTAATVMSKSAFLSLEWASKSDRWLLLGNRSGNIRLFDVKEMKSFYEATADTSYPRVINLCANPIGGSFVCSATVNRARSGSSGADFFSSPAISKVGRLTAWDLKTMRVSKQLPVEPGPAAINCCSFNHNGQLLLTGAADGVIRVFDMQQCRCISQWEAHKGEVLSVEFSCDETLCYSMGTDCKFVEWNIHKPNVKQTELPIHSGASLPFLASGLSAGKEIPKGKLFAFDSEGQYILTCDKNKGLIYKVNREQSGLSRMMELSGHKSNLTTVDWSPGIDTKVCLSGSMDGKIKVSTLLSQ